MKYLLCFIASSDEKADSVPNVSESVQSVRQDVNVPYNETEDEVANFSLDDSDRELFNNCISTAVMSARNRPHSSTSSERVNSRSVSRESSHLATLSDESVKREDSLNAPDPDALAELLKSSMSTQGPTLKDLQRNARRFWVFCVLGVFVRFVLSTATGTEFVQVWRWSTIHVHAKYIYHRSLIF